MNVSHKGLRRFGLAAVFALAGCWVGMRDLGVWQDALIYDAYYAMGAELPLAEIASKTDSLFYLIIRAWSESGGAKDGLWVLLGAVTVCLTCLALCRATTRPLVAVLTYASFLLWVQAYTQIRMSLAFAFCLASFYLVGRGLVLRVVLQVAACLTHVSLLVVVVLHVLSSRLSPAPRVVFIWAFAAATSIFIFSSFVLPVLPFDKVAVYYQLLREGAHSKINILSALPAIQVCALIAMAFSRGAAKQLATVEYKLALLGAISFYALSAVPVFAVRINELLSIFFIIVISRVVRANWAIFSLWLLYLAFSVKSAVVLLTTELAKHG